MKYDEAYRTIRHLFGTEPERILEQYWGMLDKSAPILDVGAGQGRHSLYLARKGFIVDAIDPSAVAIRTLSAEARREGLPIRTHRCGFERFQAKAGSFSGILLFGLVQELPWESIETLFTNIEEWIQSDGFVFVTCFTTEDPAFPMYAKEWKCIGKNSFRSDDGVVRTYLEPGEIRDLFPGCRVVHFWEGLGPEHKHGDGPLERHGKAELVARLAGG